LSLPVNNDARAAAHPPQLEMQHREIAMHESVVKLIHDLMIHCSAELRMRMQHDPDRCIPVPGRMVASFNASCRAGENDFGHARTSIGCPECRLIALPIPPNARGR